MALFYFTKNANASLLIEPYFGANLAGKITKSGYDEKFTGTAMGARLGYQNLGFMMGLNFHKTELDVTKSDDNIKYTSYGAFLGYNFPALVRIWGEMIFSGSGDWGSSNDVDSMGGYRLGVGFTALPFVSINFEINKPKIDFKTSGKKDYELDSYLLSISLPINI